MEFYEENINTWTLMELIKQLRSNKYVVPRNIRKQQLIDLIIKKNLLKLFSEVAPHIQQRNKKYDLIETTKKQSKPNSDQMLPKSKVLPQSRSFYDPDFLNMNNVKQESKNSNLANQSHKELPANFNQTNLLQHQIKKLQEELQMQKLQNKQLKDQELKNQEFKIIEFKNENEQHYKVEKLEYKAERYIRFRKDYQDKHKQFLTEHSAFKTLAWPWRNYTPDFEIFSKSKLPKNNLSLDKPIQCTWDRFQQMVIEEKIDYRIYIDSFNANVLMSDLLSISYSPKVPFFPIPNFEIKFDISQEILENYLKNNFWVQIVNNAQKADYVIVEEYNEKKYNNCITLANLVSKLPQKTI